MNIGPDSLDYQQQIYQRSQHNTADNSHLLHNYKYFYKQQLDSLVKQKQAQKLAQKQRQQRQRKNYNERINQTVQAQIMKDLSYKNYYNQIMSNQNNLSKNYQNIFQQRDIQKQKLILQGIQQQKKRSKQWHDYEQMRNQQMKKQYRQNLVSQINQKQNKYIMQNQQKYKSNQQYKKTIYTPQQLAKMDRERKLYEMSKYKQDLDGSSHQSPKSRNKSMSIGTKNDFNVNQIQGIHNPMVNPLPYNIQNPYILRQMRKKQNIDNNSFY